MTTTPPDGNQFVYVRDESDPPQPESPWRRWVGTRWCVLLDGRFLGIVRRSADPIRRAEAWGYEAEVGTCLGGFRSRADAAAALLRRIEAPALGRRW